MANLFDIVVLICFFFGIGRNVLCEKRLSKVLTIYSPHNPGDLIGHFQLKERLDILGIEKTYITEYDSASNRFDDCLESQSSALSGSGYRNKKYLPAIEGTDASNHDDHRHDLSTIDGIHVNSSDESVKNGQYYLNRKVFLGGHGEIWLARRVLGNGNVDLATDYVLKRMHIKDRSDILRCALREIHFGEHLKGNPRTARFLTHFQLDDDYWLVFKDEGVSLQSLLYALSINKGNVLLEPSAIWRSMRSTKRGQESMRSVLYHIIAGVGNLHARGIVHRDVKPSNILINAHEEEETGRRHTRLLIADFSSAVSDDVLARGLYGDGGPSVDEESTQYMPPEALFSCIHQAEMHEGGEEEGECCRSEPYDEDVPTSYDAWSIGVVFAEMILGTADIFSVDQRTAALITHRMRRSSPRAVDLALLLAAMSEFCIYDGRGSGDPASGSDSSTPPPDGGGGSGGSVGSRAAVGDSHIVHMHEKYLSPTARVPICGIEQLKMALQRRDPLGLGYSNPYGLDLLSRLLQWEPRDRISLSEALLHAYFVGPYVSIIDGSLHMTKDDLDLYDNQFMDEASTPASQSMSSDSNSCNAQQEPIDEDSFVGVSSTEIMSVASRIASELEVRDGMEINVDEEDIIGDGLLVGSMVLASTDDLYSLYTTTPSPSPFPIVLGPTSTGGSHVRDGVYGVDFGHGMNSLFGQVKHLMRQPLWASSLGTGDDDSDYQFSISEAERGVGLDIASMDLHAVSPVIPYRGRHHTAAATWRRQDSSNGYHQLLSPPEDNRMPYVTVGGGTESSNIGEMNSIKDYPSIEVDDLTYSGRAAAVVNNDNEEQSSIARTDVSDQLDYICPKCSRVFHGSWNSCYKHVTSRRHGDKCLYDPAAQDLHLPSCLSAHALLPLDPESGWCDLQGRRKYIEDAHAIVLADRYKFFGVFDGHWGSRAAKFASRRVQMLFDASIRQGRTMQHGLQDSEMDGVIRKVVGASDMWMRAYDVVDRHNLIISTHPSKDWLLSDAMSALHDAFVQTDEDFTSTLYPGDSEARSGSTATVAILFDEYVLIGNIGDSRAVLCCDVNGAALPLTIDHTPHSVDEVDRVLQSGGYTEDNGVLRVNGQLAVTRSIGDQQLGDIITSVPDIVVFRRHLLHSMQVSTGDDDKLNPIGTSHPGILTNQTICEDFLRFRLSPDNCNGENGIVSFLQRQHFLILGSDGLWDVMGNQEVVNFVCDSLFTQLMAFAVEFNDGDAHNGDPASCSPAGKRRSSKGGQNDSSECGDRCHVKKMPPDAFHTTARQLAQEAYIRGSMDNIGVALIDLLKT